VITSDRSGNIAISLTKQCNTHINDQPEMFTCLSKFENSAFNFWKSSTFIYFVEMYHFTKGLTQNLNLPTNLKLEYNIKSLNYIQ